MTIVGTWLVQVTLRSCQSGAALGPAFNSLVTFHADGTLTEAAAATSFAPGQRTPAHGTWTRSGPRTYQQHMLALILFGIVVIVVSLSNANLIWSMAGL